MPMLIVSIKAIHLTVPVMTVTMASNVLLSTSLLKVVITVMETVATMLDHTHALALIKSGNRNNSYIEKWGPLCNTWTPTF